VGPWHTLLGEGAINRRNYIIITAHSALPAGVAAADAPKVPSLDEASFLALLQVLTRTLQASL
jgi:hypothetical protein